MKGRCNGIIPHSKELMLTTKEVQNEILRLKKENDICILAHAYQSHNIWEVADYVGDSYGLSLQAAQSKCKTVIMCGVRFMAETVKILSPEKKVILANPDAGCPMASQMDRDIVLNLKKMYPDSTVVAYINTTSELKTVCDVCVTSSSAEKIVSNIDNDDIIFIPDCNLGSWIAKKLPQKNVRLFRGGCPTHMRITMNDVEKARSLHPNAELLVHPECIAEISQSADYVGSTTGIMKYAQESEKTEFIIGTENSIVEHLQFSCPQKRFYPLSKSCVCQNMKLTTLGDVLNCVNLCGGEEIVLSDEVMTGAKACLDKMIELGG